MPRTAATVIPISEILDRDEEAFLDRWLHNMRSSVRTTGSISEAELRQQCAHFLHSFRAGFENKSAGKSSDSSWTELREFLVKISKSRAAQGFTPTATAIFVFSFKEPLFHRLTESAPDPETLAAQIWSATELLDDLGLYTIEAFRKSREEVILRGQEEMLELSTPVVKLWNNIIALPLIGTLDSARTQVVMENLLEAIVQNNSKVAIVDITGVPTVDTVVAQHLLKTVTAARLMGAECIISGIRPQIAQTIVHLGINLLDITTKATLHDAFVLALEKTNQSILRER